MSIVLLHVGKPTEAGFDEVVEISCSPSKMVALHHAACEAIGLDWSRVCDNCHSLDLYTEEQADALRKTGIIMEPGEFNDPDEILAFDEATGDEMDLVSVYLHLVTWQAERQGVMFTFTRNAEDASIDIGGHGFSASQ